MKIKKCDFDIIIDSYNEDILKQYVKDLPIVLEYVDKLHENGELEGYIEKVIFYNGLEYQFYLDMTQENVESLYLHGEYQEKDLKNHEENCLLEKPLTKIIKHLKESTQALRKVITIYETQYSDNLFFDFQNAWQLSNIDLDTIIIGLEDFYNNLEELEESRDKGEKNE